MENSGNYYEQAVKYLLTFDGITKDVLDEYISVDEWESRKPKDIKSLFKRFLHHAQNRQSMPNSIGDINNLNDLLFDFDHIKVIDKYDTWENLFDAIKDSDYTPPGRMEKDNSRSHWVQFSKSIISISRFLSGYNNLSDWQKFVDGFLTNEQSKLALPLLLKEEIGGFGFALACDLIKENVSPEFVKPDVHINWISQELGLTKSKKDYQIFKDLEAYCEVINVSPYALDKIFWLVGSGKFFIHDIKIKSSREAFCLGVLSGESE